VGSDTVAALREWGTTHSSEQAKFALRVADALEDPRQGGPWSLLNLRQEFESRSGRGQSGRAQFQRYVVGAVRALLLAGYLLPVLVTWWHLRSAVDAFRSFERGLPEDVSVNLLTFWSGGYDGAYNGTDLVATGLQVVVPVGILLVLQLVVTVVDEFVSETEPLPHDLILEAQLAFARTRAMTPQEVTEAVSAAAEQLTVALTNVAEVVETATALVEVVGGASTQLKETSEKLERATSGLVAALTPLGELEVALRGTNESIDKSTGALENVRRSMEPVLTRFVESVLESAESMKEGFGDVSGAGRQFKIDLKDAGDSFAGLARSLGNATGDMTRKIESASEAVVRASQATDRAAAGVDNAGRALGDLSQSLGVREPHLLVIKEVASELKAAVSGMREVVEEVKQAVEMHADINRRISDEVARLVDDQDGGGNIFDQDNGRF
jgi:ABC-type transporter Mla subunit MlaD